MPEFILPIETHNALKALHLDHLFGSGNGTNPGCVPGVEITNSTAGSPRPSSGTPRCFYRPQHPVASPTACCSSY